MKKLYVTEAVLEHDADGPIGERITFREATANEIGEVAREFEDTLMNLLVDSCTPIPVRIAWAGRNILDTELHARDHCDHAWPKGEPRVHLDTKEPLFLIGRGDVERGPH
jgi:hypothetical protein